MPYARPGVSVSGSANDRSLGRAGPGDLSAGPAAGAEERLGVGGPGEGKPRTFPVVAVRRAAALEHGGAGPSAPDGRGPSPGSNRPTMSSPITSAHRYP